MSKELDDAGQLLDDLNAARNPRQSAESKVADLLKIASAHHRAIRVFHGICTTPPQPPTSDEAVNTLFTENFDGSLMRDTECKAAKAGIRVGFEAGKAAGAGDREASVDTRELAIHVDSIRHALRLLGERHPDPRPHEAAVDALQWLEGAAKTGIGGGAEVVALVGSVYEQLRQLRLEVALPDDRAKPLIDDLSKAIDLMRAR